MASGGNNDNNNSAVPAVVAGLAVGMAFIIAFSLFAQNSHVATAKMVSTVVIPQNAGIPNSGINFEPQEITVVIGYNSTVRWINRDTVSHFIEASTTDDPAFWNATANGTLHPRPDAFIAPGQDFEFTFEKPGEFGYHGQPWLLGEVRVLPPIPAS
ncbi:MAG: plastocyanin/azurin family copper-binding protein [Nitrososphaera sp.]